VVLNHLGRKEEALESYDKALELNPKDEDAQINRANLMEELGRGE
jgi:tetratricopeptide (TPR) repeat protein